MRGTEKATTSPTIGCFGVDILRLCDVMVLAAGVRQSILAVGSVVCNEDRRRLSLEGDAQEGRERLNGNPHESPAEREGGDVHNALLGFGIDLFNLIHEPAG